MKKILIFLLIVVLIGLGVGIYLYKRDRDHNENRLTLYGNVDIRQVDISFRVDGRVKELYFDEGDTVEKGKLMAKLDPEPYEDLVNQAVAQVESAKATLSNALILFKRREELKQGGSISQEDYDNALASKEVALANLDVANAGVLTAMTNLKDTEVWAPTDGWILTRIREPGTVVRATDPVLTVSVKDPVWIRAYVTEPNLGRIYPGMKGTVSTDAVNGKVYQGHIGFISPMAEFTPKTVETTQLRTDLVYRIRLIVDDPDHGLRQGMPVTVQLPLNGPNDNSNR